MQIENLVEKVVFEKDTAAQKAIRNSAEKSGIWLDSIQTLYEEIAREEVGGFTVPAINIRTLTFDIAKLIFRMMKEKEVAAFIFELARSETVYTAQPIEEYATVILAAALAEDWQGPVFVQGDHFQVNAKKFFDSQQRREEMRALKSLIAQAIVAGVYNIDIDSSTLVRLEKKTLASQQYWNYRICAELLTEFVRKLQPKEITVSVGGEIGEIGGENSTPRELAAFVKGYQKRLASGVKGLSKISVQSGARHGGIVLPDGSIKKVMIDFETLKELSRKAKKHGMAGAVQHGASTLPIEYFDKFPEVGCLEIHLATEYQNVVYDHLPQDLREEMYDYCRQHFMNEKKPDDTETQFLYRTRKKALGPYKEKLWRLPAEARNEILSGLRRKFEILFQKLRVEGTQEIIQSLYPRRN